MIMKHIGYGLLFVMIVMASYVNGVESKLIIT
jgi:hypothetical protein